MRALILFVVCFTTAHAQSWTRVTTLSEGGTQSIHADDAGLYVVGNLAVGFVLHRSDDGTAWTELRRTSFATSPFTYVYENIWTDPDSDGQIVFNYGNGGMQRSLDGGATWTETSAFSTSFVNAVRKLGDGYVAVTQSGLAPAGVFTSTDGLAWTRIETAPPGNAYDVLVDGEVVLIGFLSSAQSFGVARSADGGATWTVVLESFGHLRLVRTPEGILAGGSDSTRPWRRSTDGGLTWNGETVPLQFSAQGAAASGDVAALLDARVHVSSDGGATFADVTDAGPGASCFTDVAVREAVVFATSACPNDRSGVWRYDPGTSTSVEAQPQSLDLRAVPNPTTGAATLVSRLGAAQINVYDATGREVAAVSAPSSGRVTLPALAPGVYAVRAVGKDGRTAVTRLTIAR